MLHEQKLPTRYVDKEKLDRFWETNDDFKGKGCGIVDVGGRSSPVEWHAG